ncbi:aminotransferase class V-fold PLP-dependent enzyme [Paenibacillus thiaminolyticus]|uniref:aminotransferase class V-fold PLP-dependent enzyme n=1 Tax=Paenibacillus thiaminolyticus TaxID=49283 RepID=UPI001164540A|nr:aminotransferase class V-fold PLP-dependent enzyme [Paenibacillus thiaminolyticus]NGP60536.1 aminotransferase class V-fold PLP-dependent enzyme [Paenibacillus thiaminolyticus]WCR25826.1 aminotransferase class V-fold PLP-dependent enzyme [Paenibacillus thiaminolyticus]
MRGTEDAPPIIYMDHAATSWPKPACVMEAMQRSMLEEGGNPGRGGHRMSVKAGKRILHARMAVAKLFQVANPVDIAWMANTTMALNTAIHGYVRPGDHVVATGVEHNSVTRPLDWLMRHHRVEATYVEADASGTVDLHQIRQAMKPHTRLVICNHSSNLFGSIQPVGEIADIAHDYGAKLLVDAAQSAGLLPISAAALGIDMLAFPGHKGLLGPQGTGGLYIDPDLDVHPLVQGGTGSYSDEAVHPATRPDCYEAGTPNTIGIAGLEAGVRYVLQETVEARYKKEWELAQKLMESIERLPGLHVLGPALGQPRTGIVSLISDRIDSSVLAHRLDREFGIAVRAGYHCTPAAHRAAGTLESGALRISVGWNTTEADIEKVTEALHWLCIG